MNGRWWEQAACRGMDTELWFAADQERGQRMHAAHAAAVEVCTGCPVASDCLADALRFEACRSLAYRHGVWGGVRAAERVRLDAARRTRPGPYVPVHGTPTGYRRGCRCLPCCDAKTVDQRQRREERRRKVDG